MQAFILHKEDFGSNIILAAKIQVGGIPDEPQVQ